MSNLPEHKPEPWFWEAGSASCPHGPEPDQQSSAWDAWAERHTSSPQDVFVCLDAPMGDHYPACFDENGGDPTPWALCGERGRNTVLEASR